ncbi:MAG: hypothetical protein LKF53_03890 [Solobacterium sp.]|jgi:hypothetical protein|nr:hypothetical protein [Solobacterium sp.]MCH4205515.1 hypothetical protein [Solobacterium sp.]MCH4227039.1 hypothetical protein [Solobacterium sp.]MCH4282202.1 hypothetical protein [Solobacterium sp.]
MEYQQLREKYTEFIYHSFKIETEENKICITYDMEIKGLASFHPTFAMPCPKGSHIMDTALFRTAVFSLGMVELISYWKISCAPHVTVECGSLDEYQIQWWKKLYFNGLGEFFYKNHISTSMDECMDLRSTGGAIEGMACTQTYTGNLIPVGGGKDSFVTLHLLEPYRKENCAFIINHIISAVNAAHAAGYQEGKDLLIVERTLDPAMLELNQKGYLNGHTPFSAMAAFASYLTAIVWQRKYITLSNEASANESTIKGSSVNHQYSKTFAFEQDFNQYAKRYLTDEIHYFSLLRPLSELQIAGIFTKLKKYLPVFRSCNVGQKKGIWCGHCAKCLFVCIMMSAYLAPDEVIAIFGRDMLNDPEMRQLFQQLSGILDDKPFECVGTRDEVNTAICMSIRGMKEKGREIPLLYQEYQKSKYYAFYQNRSVDMLAYNEENDLPDEYAQLVQKELRNNA